MPNLVHNVPFSPKEHMYLDSLFQLLLEHVGSKIRKGSPIKYLPCFLNHPAKQKRKKLVMFIQTNSVLKIRNEHDCLHVSITQTQVHLAQSLQTSTPHSFCFYYLIFIKYKLCFHCQTVMEENPLIERMWTIFKFCYLSTDLRKNDLTKLKSC